MFCIIERKYFIMAVFFLGLMLGSVCAVANTTSGKPVSIEEQLKKALQKRNVSIRYDVPVTIQEMYIEGIVINIICYVGGVRAEELNPEMNDMLGIVFKESEDGVGESFILYIYFYMIHSADEEQGSMLYGVVRATGGLTGPIDGARARLFLLGSGS